QYGVADAAGARSEWRCHDHSQGAVPEGRFALEDPGAEIEPRGLIDVEHGAVGRDVIARHLAPLGGARETGRDDRTARQDQLGAGPGEQILGEILLVALDQRAAYLKADRQ